MKPGAIVFDIDGTLWDASESSARGFEMALQKAGLSDHVLPSTVRKLSGRPWDEIFKALVPSDAQNLPQLKQRMDEAERIAIEQYGGTFFPYVRETLSSLSKRYPLFIVSNCQDWYLAAFMKWLNAPDTFSDQTCFGITRAPKHEMILSLLDKHTVADALYVGDTCDDFLAAQKAGCRFVQAFYGFDEKIESVQGLNTFADLNGLLQ